MKYKRKQINEGNAVENNTRKLLQKVGSCGETITPLTHLKVNIAIVVHKHCLLTDDTQ